MERNSSALNGSGKTSVETMMVMKKRMRVAQLVCAVNAVFVREKLETKSVVADVTEAAVYQLKVDCERRTEIFRSRQQAATPQSQILNP